MFLSIAFFVLGLVLMVFGADLLVRGASAIAFPLMASGRLITRLEGCVMLGYYGAYTAYLILHAKQSPHAASLLFGILYIALPATVTWLLLQFWLARRTAAH